MPKPNDKQGIKDLTPPITEIRQVQNLQRFGNFTNRFVWDDMARALLQPRHEDAQDELNEDNDRQYHFFDFD